MKVIMAPMSEQMRLKVPEIVMPVAWGSPMQTASNVSG
jgi:hypothetical protein